MIRVAFLVCGDRETAHEAVAAAWPLAWRRLRALREPERLRPWLASIAANEARRLVRRHAVRSVREIPMDVAELRGAGDPAARVDDLDLGRRAPTAERRRPGAAVAALHRADSTRPSWHEPPGARHPARALAWPACSTAFDGADRCLSTTDAFERRLHERLQAHVAPEGLSFDAATVAATAIERAGPRAMERAPARPAGLAA